MVTGARAQEATSGLSSARTQCKSFPSDILDGHSLSCTDTTCQAPLSRGGLPSGLECAREPSPHVGL